jgi:alpha-tubulin suppressor-like RCC1 family protein
MTLPCSHIPVAVGGELHFSALTAGRFHTCGITTDGLVYCWGNHTTGQLGTAGPFENCGLLLRSSEPMPCNRDPAPIAADLRATRVTAGAFHTCAIATDNTAHCWGHGFQAIPTPIPEGRQFVSVDAGGLMTCALANDQIPWCWGSFYHPFTHFQISGTHPSKGGFWSDKTPDHHFTSLTVGSGHICGLAVGGQAFCWGRGTEGQLGSSQRLGRLLSDERWTAEPVPVEGNLRFTSLSAGDGHTCGTTSSGRAYCWGNNELGQLGDGSTSKRDTPAAVLESAIAMRWP